MIKILNKFGLFSRAQISLLKVQKEKAEKDRNDIVFDFDSLLSKYNAVQINALFYKLINVCWKSNDKKHLLKRFKERIYNATEEKSKD